MKVNIIIALKRTKLCNWIEPCGPKRKINVIDNFNTAQKLKIRSSCLRHIKILRRRQLWNIRVFSILNDRQVQYRSEFWHICFVCVCSSRFKINDNSSNTHWSARWLRLSTLKILWRLFLSWVITHGPRTELNCILECILNNECYTMKKTLRVLIILTTCRTGFSISKY